MLYAIFVTLVLVSAGAVLVWNFYPPARQAMRGVTTFAEAGLGFVMTMFGMFTDVIKEAEAAGAIPSNWVQYVPFVLLAWIVIKRLQTKTPAGKRF
jgi:hypothetical protein